jgi:hypothetical protein
MTRQIISTPIEELIPIFKEQLASGQTVRFSPKGISMMPMLRQGIDVVEISPLPAKLKKFDIPLYQRDDGKYVLHRVVAVGETYTCIGDNQFHQEPGLRYDQMIAVVTAFRRGNREISVRNPGYRAYCLLWHYSRPIRFFMYRAKRRLIHMMKK